ncbi:MAG TPA: aa3-type cytochrome c oxidase subunit IV [Caulobacteraceae bacterium]|nr:aa3-type cytochrome c oxidase subunit IV [Caulobacteraceae bacterium]
MAETAAEHPHLNQDPSEQVETWHRFLWLTKWFVLHIAVIMIACTLWFAAGASFFGGLIPALIVFFLGAQIPIARRRPGSTH